MPFSSFSATSWFAPCCKRLVIALSWSCLQFTYFNWSERFLILQHLTCVIFSVYLNSLSHFKADEDGWMFHPLCLSYGRLLKGGLIRQEMYAHEQSVDDVSIIITFLGLVVASTTGDWQRWCLFMTHVWFKFGWVLYFTRLTGDCDLRNN